MEPIDISQSEEIYTISRLNREVRLILEGSFSFIWVEGEISNFSCPQSGHWYFSLKDATAQVRCAMFKPHNRKINFLPKDGMQVIGRARVSLYEGRGDFQLLLEFIEEAGVGKLQREFEALKKRLHAAGLFDDAHKKPIPVMPRTIGVVTSPTGAAIRDILHILKRRFPAANVIIYPTLVQGETAAANIVAAIQTANRRKECDVLIVTRGGGSLEDLWPFNEEIVAHAIYKSVLPIISGVGHEIDFTIADFVADLRAPTPSAAAEMATPDSGELLHRLQQALNRLYQLFKQRMLHFTQHLVWLEKHIAQFHPKRQLLEKMQQLDGQEIYLVRLQQQLINQLQAKLQAFAVHLNSLSPLATLKRGYAIATRADGKSLITSAQQVAVGERIHLTLQHGALCCAVEALE